MSSIRVAASLLLLFACSVRCEDTEADVLFANDAEDGEIATLCRTAAQKKAAELPDFFKTDDARLLRALKFNASSSQPEAKIFDVFDKKSAQLSHQAVTYLSQSDARLQWLFEGDDTNKWRFVDADNTCKTVEKKYAKETPLGIEAGFFTDYNIEGGVWANFKSLLTFAGGRAITWQNITGMETTFTSCFKTTHVADKTEVFVQTEVRYLAKWDAVKGPIKAPITVKISSYDTKNSTAKQLFSYTIHPNVAPLETRTTEKYLMPPLGVYCEGGQTGTPPTSPDNFMSTVMYVNVSQKEIDTTHVFYSKQSQLFAFDYLSTPDAPFVSTLGNVNRRVVHDFIYGVQFDLDPTGATCKQPTALPSTSVELVNKTKLRDAFQLLTQGTNNITDWVKSGQRTLPNGVVVDVMVAQQSDDNDTTIEALVLPSTWTVVAGDTPDKSAPKQSTLYGLVVYHWENNKLKSSTTMLYSTVFNRPKAADLTEFDVAPCLTDIQYYAVNMTGATLDSIRSEFGYKPAVNSLVNQLATKAGVSALRIPASLTYFFTPDDGTNLMLFFTISNKTLAKQTPAFKQEVDLQTALDSLNATLSKQDISVKLNDKLTVTINKDSLTEVSPSSGHVPPPAPKPGPDVKGGGMGGGAAFALSLCMLCVGAVLGVLGAWWMWKRNRGIAYQVFESRTRLSDIQDDG